MPSTGKLSHDGDIGSQRGQAVDAKA